MRWLSLAGACLLLAGCGGSSSPKSSPKASGSRAPKPRLVFAGLQPPAGCYITVFLVDHATKAQIKSVQNRLLAHKGVIQIDFVSRGLALERFTKKDPVAAKGMRINPFSDQFEVVPRTPAAARSVVFDFATHGGPITNAVPGGTCADQKR